MYCQKCNAELTDNAKFCSECGATQQTRSFTQRRNVNLNKPMFTARPVFVPWVTIASVIPIQLFMTVWAGLFFGGFSMFAVKFIGLNLPEWSTFVFFGALAFFGIPFLAYYAKKRTYEKTVYKFFPDRFEYTEGFWTTENKTIKYKNITEVNMRKGVIQKKYDLGTIVLSTPAIGVQRGRAQSGIRISDIQDSENIYKKVLKLVD